MSEYPLFLPPSDLAEKGRKQWSRKEAQAYYDWLMEAIPLRTADLLRWFGQEEGSKPEKVLVAIGSEFADALLHDSQLSTSSENGLRLTNRGYAIAADAGLLMARYLCEECGPQVHWELLRKPKNELSYNLPILVGFDMYLEPVRGFVAESWGILDGTRNGGVLIEGFRQWRQKARDSIRQ